MHGEQQRSACAVCRGRALGVFGKCIRRVGAANSAGASLLLSVHGNSDPYSSDSSGLECYPQPPGRTHHEDSLRLAHLIAEKFGAAGQRLRGNAGVRYIYYAGDDESGYEKQVVEEDVYKRQQPVRSAAPGQDGPAKPGAAQRLRGRQPGGSFRCV